MRYQFTGAPSTSTSTGVKILMATAIAAAVADTKLQNAEPRAEAAMVIAMRNANAKVEDPAVTQIASEVILSLLDDRDYLGYMVGHARGQIDDTTMEELTSERLQLSDTENAALVHKVAVLAALIGDRIDSELVATVFRCDVIKAIQAIEAWRDAQHA